MMYRMEERKIIRVIAKLMPTVVSVIISKHLEDVEKEVPHELAHLFSSKQRGKSIVKIPDSLIDRQGFVKIGGGSGFITKTDGLILTNKHVVSDSRAVHTVILNDGQKHKATVICPHPNNHLPIFKN